jgi:CBS domain containing-hemolysin-like protein
VEHSAREGVIDSKEHEMLQAVVAAGQVSTREIMTPRVDIDAESIESSRRAFMDHLKAGRARRLLVYGRDLDDIRGVIYARDLYLKPRAPVGKLVKPAHFVPEQINLVQLLLHFRRENVEFAVVVDEYGGTAGLVSVGHVTDWILGSSHDAESATAPTTQRVDENTYRVSGNLSARAWAERFAVRQIDRHVDTVGGLILAALGRMPKAGDSVRIGNLTLTVERVNKRRIERILLRRDEWDPQREPSS